MDTPLEMGNAPVERRRCRNCGKKLSKTGDFCAHCGQRDVDGKIKLSELLLKFWGNITHLDNKFLKMSWQLLIPAKVTLQYFRGKIKPYPHPVQFFFIVMFFFLLLTNTAFQKTDFNMLGGSLQINDEEFYTLETGGPTFSDSDLYTALEHIDAARRLRQAGNNLPDSLRSPAALQAVEAVVSKVEGPWERAVTFLFAEAAKEDSTLNNSLDTVSLLFFNNMVRLATSDMVNSDPENIIQRYGFTHWIDKVTVRQGIKSIKNPKGLISSYVGSFGWAILILILGLSGLLKLLYLRSNRYYTEHFIFLIHHQAGAYLFLTISMVLSRYVFEFQWLWLAVWGWLGLSLLLAMKWFYRQNWGWTLLKWLAMCTAYLLGMVVLFIATLIVVFLLF